MSLRKQALFSVLATLLLLAVIVPLMPAEASQSTQAEKQVVNLINQSRTQNGLDLLQADPSLTRVAQEQAQELANNPRANYAPVNNLMRTGDYKNVRASVLRSSNVDYAVRSYLGRSGNAALSNQHDLVGVGIADCRTFGKVCVQIFAKGQSAAEQVQAKPQPQQPQPQQPQQKPEPQETQQAPMGNFQKQVVDLVNQERAKNGLRPLVAKADLNRVAQVKAEDMAQNRYFSHTSPTYGSPFDMMRQFGISYTRAGENIAMGHRTPDRVVEGWMNSSGHRANILNPNFAEIGVGFTDNGYYWVQLFARR